MSRYILRPEQEELVTKVLGKSGVVVAPTGFGKTIIAIEILTRMTLNTYGVVLFPTTILRDQFTKSASDLLPLIKIDSLRAFRCLTRDMIRGKILCMTIALYLLTYKELSLRDILIVDQIHRIANNHTTYYHEFSKSLTSAPFIGFTASLSSNVKKTAIKKLTGGQIYNVDYNSPHERIITTHSIPLPEVTKVYRLAKTLLEKKYSRILTLIGPSLFHGPLGRLIHYKSKPTCPLKSLNPTIHYTYNRFIKHRHYLDLLFYQSKSVAQAYAERSFGVNPFQAIEDQLPAIPEKFKRLLPLVKSNGTTLVFFDNYETLLDFKRYLQGNDSTLGVAVLAGKSKVAMGLRKKLLKEIHEGVVDVILSTSVAEEGVDIKSVERVVFYEPVSSQVRYVQRIGRTARHDRGYVDVLDYAYN